MKKILTLFALIAFYITNAQVGINNLDPKATLDISANATPSKTDGLLLPRMASFPATNPGAEQNSMIIYLTTDLTSYTIPTGTAQDYSKGFYYWDNNLTNWISFEPDSGDAWLLDGNGGTDGGTTDFMGTTDNQPISFRTNNVERVKFGVNGNIETFQPGSTVALGREAGLLDDQSNNQNVFIGDFSGQNTVGTDTTLILNGVPAEGAQNVAVGYEALKNNQLGWYNTAVGYRSQATVDGIKVNNAQFRGVNNSSLGWSSLEDNTDGDNNTAIGWGALRAGNYGDNNVGVGSAALANANNAADNIAIGRRVLLVGDNSTKSVGIGTNVFEFGSNIQNSISIGHLSSRRAGQFATGTFSDNVAIGHQTLLFNRDGIQNTVVGSRAGEELINAVSFSIAIGAHALRKNHGQDNTALGNGAGEHDLSSSDHGDNNIYIGKDSGNRATVSNSIFIGTSAGIDEQTTDNVLHIEHAARTGDGVETSTDTPLIYGEFDNNVVRVGGQLQVGRSDGTAGSIYAFPTTDGTNGQVLTTDGAGVVTWENGSGSGADTQDLSIDNTTAVLSIVDGGSVDLKAIADADSDTKIQVEEAADEDAIRFDVAGIERFVMTNRGQLEIFGDNTVRIGENAGEALINDRRSVFVGHLAGQNIGSNFYNVAVGWESMANATGTNNNGTRNSVAVGARALNNSNAPGNTAVGAFTLENSTTAEDNTAVGTYALGANITGNKNTAIGRDAMRNNTAGGENTALGHRALLNNFANNNTAIGAFASQSNLSGTSNVALGKTAATSNMTGSQNTSLGHAAHYLNRDGSNNTMVGEGAGYYEMGNRNTYFGRGAGGGDNMLATPRKTQNGNVMIGYEAGVFHYGSDSKLFVANSNTNIPLIAGDFTEARVGINTNVDTNTPGVINSLTHTLNVGGSVKIQTLMTLNPSTTPASPARGDVYYDNATNKVKVYTGVGTGNSAGAGWEDLN